tara:strand:+ start:855 stop:1130 length:276 start_codon:yes stop_codon:yes gene_type:complete
MDKFAGSNYQPERDDSRLTKQIDRVYNACSHGDPMTLSQISQKTGDPEASVSAQLRHLRKAKNGEHRVDKLHISSGLYAYRLIPNESRTST